ncbi:hypothetical protein AB5I41_30180 [Sphingomonas sp. MMS24-JH45]
MTNGSTSTPAFTAPANGMVAQIAGLKAPLTATLGGRLEGLARQAAATLGGGQFADLNVIAQSGRIRVAGMTRPGLYLEGPVERLTTPGGVVDTDTRLDQRRAETRIKLKSDALSVDAGGISSLRASRSATSRSTRNC